MTGSKLIPVLFAYVALIHMANSLPTYQAQIPNGDRVPSPCNPATIWPGVGHNNPSGGGDRNPFGQKFAALNHNWTAVCPLDSDGDGRSNGEELGDPTCSWTPNNPYPKAVKLSHPGVCEPLNETRCASTNSWLTCPPQQLNCPAIQQTGVMNMSLQLPPTRVPAKQTTYMCYGFVFPDDIDYHVIATAPIVTNPNILHHILVYTCKDPPANAAMFKTPTECVMGNLECSAIMDVWTVGSPGQCLADAYGYHIGRSGYRYAILQVHWNNALMSDNLVDNPGIAFYYTRNLRANNGMIVTTGQQSLTIPPGRSSFSSSGTCSSQCTRSALKQPVYIASAILHMHLLGVSGIIWLIQNGTKTAIVNQTAYDFNAPVAISFGTPLTLQPGDEIRVDCRYNSLSRNVTTTFGEGTNDEMCLGFLVFYPAVDVFSQCVQYDAADLCLNGALLCNLTALKALAMTLPSVGCAATACPPSCKAAMQSIVDTGCLSGLVGTILTTLNSLDQLVYLRSLCGLDPDKVVLNSTTPVPGVATDVTLHHISKLFALSAFVVTKLLW